MVKFISMQGSFYFDMLNFNTNRRRIEDSLSEYYGDGSISVFGLPVGAPPEIPRMICVSKNGHSQVQISDKAIQISVRFDDNYADNIDLCYDYMKERAGKIKEILTELGIKISFVGIVAQTKKGEESLEEITKKIFPVKTNKKIFDILGRITFVKDDKYYINVTVNNIRDGITSKDIGVSLDVNDRYRLNFSKNEASYSEDNVLDRLLEIHYDFFKNDVDKLLKEGVYNE